MRSIYYNNEKTLTSNVLELFKFVNWLYREMLIGRVKCVTDKANENDAKIVTAEQEVTELDLANIVSEQSLTDLDLRVLALESEE